MTGAVSYVLFFIVSLTSLLGLTSPLTGSYGGINSTLLYGLSFYTVSLAYIIHQQKMKLALTPFAISNPLLTFTGPFATLVSIVRHKSFQNRFNYYFPFVILGLFLYQAIATPLTRALTFFTATDAASSIAYATVFELFIYANFCGLSLLAYGLAGILGFKIPLNFRQPFSATNMVDFWKGWHTSFSTVLKTMFYQPTKKIFGTSVALLVVYMASAIWHGVTFNFLLWGLFHAGVFIVTLMLLRRRYRYPAFVLMIIAVIVGRIIFADSDSARLLEKLQFAFTDFSVIDQFLAFPNTTKLSLLLIVMFVLAEFFLRNTKYFRKRNYKLYRLPVFQLLLLILILLTITRDIGVDFAVYGQR